MEFKSQLSTAARKLFNMLGKNDTRSFMVSFFHFIYFCLQILDSGVLPNSGVSCMNLIIHTKIKPLKLKLKLGEQFEQLCFSISCFISLKFQHVRNALIYFLQIKGYMRHLFNTLSRLLGRCG